VEYLLLNTLIKLAQLFNKQVFLKAHFLSNGHPSPRGGRKITVGNSITCPFGGHGAKRRAVKHSKSSVSLERGQKQENILIQFSS